MCEPWLVALDLGRDLTTAGAVDAYVSVALPRLCGVLGADAGILVSRLLPAGRMSVHGQHGPEPGLSQSLSTSGADHPGLASYLDDPTDLSPRRVSDVVDPARWRATSAYRDVFGPRDQEHQLSVVVELAPRWSHAWLLTRRDPDFTDHEVGLARWLQPVLTLAWGHLAPARPPPTGLSPREEESLRLLASGCTATAMARSMGISARTVRKHIDSVYAKLDVHDRLLAVQRAVELGLIAPPLRN